jgi:hypothetical protein
MQHLRPDRRAAAQGATSQAIGAATERNFRGPIQTIIPWASNLYTETLIERVRGEFGEDFWGFWMLGGMAGGGMGFIFDPRRKGRAGALQVIMREVKRELESAQCPSPWIRWSTILRSTSAAPGPNCARRTTR